MSEIFSHICPCGIAYKDTDPDVYFCETCKAQRKIIAKQIDAKLAGKVARNVKSDLQLYDEARTKSGMNFPRIRDLGITL